MTDSKDTQEEKSQPDQTILPSCLNLDVLTKKQGAQSTEDLKNNVVLSCMKLPKVEDPEEEPRCPRYSCTSGPTLLNCSTISSIQTYHPVQCHKEGQKLQRESLKCRAKSSEDLKIIDLCCPPEVLENVTLEDTEEEPWATKKLSAMDPQEAIVDHQTLKHHWSAPRKLRSSQELPTLAYPTPINTQLCLRTGPDYQHPRLGQESSQGWVIAAGAMGILGAVVGLVFLGYLVVRWWRGRRKERHLSKKLLRAEESLGKEKDGDWGTPGM